MSSREGFKSPKQIREFHLNPLDVFHNATHSVIALGMDLHRYKTWHHVSILAQVQARHTTPATNTHRQTHTQSTATTYSAGWCPSSSLLLGFDLQWT